MLEVSRTRNKTILPSATLTLFLEAFLQGLNHTGKETITFRVQTEMEATQTNDKLLHFISEVAIHDCSFF